MALNNLQCLIFHKTKQNQTKYVCVIELAHCKVYKMTVICSFSNMAKEDNNSLNPLDPFFFIVSLVSLFFLFFYNPIKKLAKTAGAVEYADCIFSEG